MSGAASSIVWGRQVVWITGASSGIGAALSLALAAHGAGLILSGRSTERLSLISAECRAMGARVWELPFEMADAPARRAALQWVADNAPPVSVLVNNAGVSQRSMALETDAAVERELFEVNYWGPVELTRAIVPGMIARGDGLVVAVSSIAALAGVPLRSSYSAAKAALWRYTAALANELAGTPVRLVTVVPGFVHTNVSHNARTGSGSSHGLLDPNQAGGISSTAAAAEILRQLERGRSTIYAGLVGRARLMVWAARWMPALLDRSLAKEVQR